MKTFWTKNRFRLVFRPSSYVSLMVYDTVCTAV